MKELLIAAFGAALWIAAGRQPSYSPLFTDVTSEAGIRFRHGASHTSQKYLIETMGSGAAFFDYDGDGRLDLIVARYLDWDFEKNIWCGPEKVQERGYCHPNAFQPVTHLLYHNEGSGKFRDVSQASGIAAHPGKGLGVA